MADTATDRPKIITPEDRLMWAWLFKPRLNKKTGEPSYQCDVVFTPAAMRTPEFAALKAAAEKAAVDKFGDKLRGLIAAEKFINPFWKNERKIDAETGKLPDGYEPGGCYITLKSKHRPGIVQNTAAGLQPIIDENEVYAGCWVRASVDCWAFDNESKGVNFGLANVMKIRDDTPLGSRRTKAEDDFAGIAAPPAAAAGGTAAAGSLFGGGGLI